jgi:hypothetical protein
MGLLQVSRAEGPAFAPQRRACEAEVAIIARPAAGSGTPVLANVDELLFIEVVAAADCHAFGQPEGRSARRQLQAVRGEVRAAGRTVAAADVSTLSRNMTGEAQEHRDNQRVQGRSAKGPARRCRRWPVVALDQVAVLIEIGAKVPKSGPRATDARWAGVLPPAPHAVQQQVGRYVGRRAAELLREEHKV